MGAGLEKNKCHFIRTLLHERSLHSLKERDTFLFFLGKREGVASPVQENSGGFMKESIRFVYPKVPIPVLRVLFFPSQGLESDIRDLLKLCMQSPLKLCSL